MILDSVLIVLLTLYAASSVLLYIYGINSYVMIALFLRNRSRRRDEERSILERFSANWSDEDLPTVTTQLPVFNERNVVERLLLAVCAFDYPKEKHEIQLLDDSTDETVMIAGDLIADLNAQGHDVKHIRRQKRKGFKAGALAEGLRQAAGEYVAIFDADFVPPPDFLKRTMPFLLEEKQCGFVQTRWGHRNSGFSPLTFAQSVGIDGHFVVEQSARAWNGLFFNFNGTAGVWRKRAIEDAGGWMADTLTEDLDLSYRTLLAGWGSRYLLDVITPAEIPTNINALKSQQRRWAKGSIQTAMKLLPTVWKRPDLALFKKIQATLHLTHYLIHPLIFLITLLVVPLLYVVQIRFSALYVAPIVALMFLALLGPSTLYVFSQGVTHGNWRRTLLWMPALMSLGIGLAVNNTRAVFEGLMGRRGEFVRTPKLGSQAEASGAIRDNRSYRQPLSRLFMVEILMGLWALSAFLGSISVVGFAASPFLLIQAVGFTYVGLTSIAHHRAIEKQV